VTLLPVDGNVHRHMATIAHPEPISSLVSSFDGHFLFSSGMASAGIHVWQVNPSSLFAASRLGGDGLEPFLNMLEGGKTGEFLHQLEDYFYFAQIRAQGEDSMEKRVVCSVSDARWRPDAVQVSDKVPLAEVPSIFRALGCFLSEYEINV
jgi:hypothetical protein